MASFQNEKAYVLKYFQAMEEASETTIAQVQSSFIAADYDFYGSYPFNKLTCLQDVADSVWQPIYKSFKNIQRRQDVFMAGNNEVSDETGL